VYAPELALLDAASTACANAPGPATQEASSRARDAGADAEGSAVRVDVPSPVASAPEWTVFDATVPSYRSAMSVQTNVPPPLWPAMPMPTPLAGMFSAAAIGSPVLCAAWNSAVRAP